MHDPLDNPEIAVASKNRGGRFGQDGRILIQPASSRPTSKSSTPRAATSRGVCVFAPLVFFASLPRVALSRQAPPAATRAAPACPAGRRIVET